MKLILVRHLAPAIAPGICYGRLDPDLSGPALAQLPDFAATLRRHLPALLRSSPARRCRRIAEAVATGAPPIIDPRLQELDFGAWEGTRWDRMARAALDAWAADPLGFAAPGGETGAALLRRVSELWAELREEGADCLLISHGGPLRVLAALARGLPPDLLAPAPPLGSVSVIAC